jgi:hypothetical protein
MSNLNDLLFVEGWVGFDCLSRNPQFWALQDWLKVSRTISIGWRRAAAGANHVMPLFFVYLGTLHCTMEGPLKGIYLGSNCRFSHYLWWRLPGFYCWNLACDCICHFLNPLSAPLPPKFPKILCHSLTQQPENICRVPEVIFWASHYSKYLFS